MASQAAKGKTGKPGGNDMAEAMDYDDRMLEIPEGVDSLAKYLQEGFWPQYINIFSDFGVSVNFFVDGDALLMRCFEDKLLDWAHGGQPLQVFYRYLQFLNDLLFRRASRFHLLFFSNAEQYYSGSKLAMRKSLIRYLKSTTDVKVVDTITSIDSEEYDLLFDVQQPAFVIAKKDFQSIDGVDQKLEFFCQSFLLKSLNSNNSGMLLDDDVEFEGPQMKAWTLLERPADEVSTKLLADAATIRTECKTKPANAFDGKLDKGRVSVAVEAIRRQYAAEPASAELCKLFLLHVVLLEHFPPAIRSGPLPETLPKSSLLDQVPDFLTALWPHIVGVLDTPQSAGLAEATLCDLWDGRFLIRLAISVQSKTNLGLPENINKQVNDVIASAGVGDGLSFKPATGAEVTACSDCLDKLANEALASSNFESDSMPLPMLPSVFLDQVAPEAVELYGGRSAGSAELTIAPADDKASKAKVEVKVDAEEDDDEAPDDWDAESDDDAPDDWDADSNDGDGGDDNNDAPDQAALVDADQASSNPDAVETSESKPGDEVELSPPTKAWSSLEPLDEEGDAYNTQVILRHVQYDGDQQRALSALKFFVGKLRKRSQGKLKETELEECYNFMINELEVSQQTNCANDLKDFFKKNRFANGLEKLIVRKWQGKMKAQREEQSTLRAIRDFAESLTDRVIKTESIVETDENAADNKVSIKSAVMSSRESIKKTVKISTDRKVDLDQVLEKVQSDTKRGRFADAWLKLDDFLLERCEKDKDQYNLTHKAIANLKARTAEQKSGAGGKGKKSGGKRGGGKKADEPAEEMDQLLKQYDEGLKVVSDHNVQVIALAARVQVTFTWWLEQYAKSDVCKAANAADSGLDALMADALDNELWACGQVVAEIFKVHGIASADGKFNADLAQDLSTYLYRLGFPKESLQLLQQSNSEISDKIKDAVTNASVPIDRKGRTLYDFQMANMGPLLLRPKGKPDMRVKRFKPDTWQKELLDAVDETGKWRRKCKDLAKARRGLSMRAASDIVKEKEKLSAKSILVSAPTSSGKTFISFYAMEQILREASLGEGVVVYVSPTKALVNQVEADLYARYDKSYHTMKKSQARSMHGVFLKEYRTNVNDCQVLVTVPECLEIIMLDPLYSKLAARIRWVVFDEVHCISKEGGAVWERLLISTQATFIALSATIGNPKDFADWLTKIEESKGHELLLVTVESRINDLSINIYDSFTSPDQIVRESDRIVPINPLGVLSVELIRSQNGVPNQTKLLPEHCWQIIHAAVDLTAELDSADVLQMVRSLDLQTKVSAAAVSMIEAASIEKEIKKFVTHLVFHHEDIAQKLFERLGGRAADLMEMQDEACKTGQMEYLETHLLSCLQSLDAAGLGSEDDNSLKRLPAIVFHLSVRGCTRIVQQLLESLEDLQAAAQVRTFCKIVLPEYSSAKCEQQKLTGVESDIVYRIRATDVDEASLDDEELKKAVEMSKQTQSVTCNELRGFLQVDQETDWTKPLSPETKKLFKRIDAAKVKYYEAVIMKCNQENERREKDYEDELKADPAGEEYHVPPQIIDFAHLEPGFIDRTYSFLPQGKPMTEDDLKEHLGRWYDPSDFKTRALQRGIGLHFPELPRKYKNAVERLFRVKKLRVVVATSTLALGINMPCKTAIIAGDEPHLNALEFHQMIGRAGRRTFDNRGNVVFIGTPSRKIARLLSSNVADLVGNVPLTPGLALRSYLRFRQGHSKEDKDGVVAMTKRLISMPLLSMGDSSVQTDQLLFCMDFLMHNNMRMLRMNSKGNDVEPTGVCQMLAHLYFLEPYNFMIVSLLQRGVFDRLVTKYSISPDATDLEKERTLEERNLALLQLFANLIYPKVLPKRMRGCDSTDVSDVRLPALPADIMKEITEYNNFVLERFSLYMRRYATVRSEILGSANILPGSKSDLKNLFKNDMSALTNAGEDTVIGALHRTTMTVKARSPFLALSGHNDKFTSLSDLLGSLRNGLYLDRALVPMLPEINRPVNSYLVDFYNTGERLPLSQKNGLRDYKIFDDLNEVSHAIRVIKDMVERRLGNDDTTTTRLNTMEAFDLLETKFTKIFKDEFAFS